MDKGSPHLISKHWAPSSGSVPPNILEFQHSFGYNCKKLFNIVLMGKDYIVFSSGNLLHYYNIPNNSVTFRRSSTGGGIGFILKNPDPTLKHLTVLENGENPVVIIYQFPEHKVVSLLEKGAQNSFTCAAYSPNGELLATQAGGPDYMLTIWKWKTSSVILRAQSFQNDVLNVSFSMHNPILLSTCGLGHVKFWKMARTFTGLKLQGDLGRFGKTEICDIYAVYMLADEKVISGCEWGNMLVWEAGLIKLEVCRKGRKPCHNGPITQITLDNGEVMTVGMDGYVRIWFWETVELADPPDEDRFVEIEPTYEFRIGDKTEFCECRGLVKIDPLDRNDFDYYAQDGNGGIWLCNLDTEEVPKPPTKLFFCHGGRVVDGNSCPVSNHFATFGEDGRLSIYNYVTKKLIYQKKYLAGGSKMIWLPLKIDPSGVVILLGFEDGVIRQVALNLERDNEVKERAFLVSAMKPHAVGITALAINPNGDVLVSGAKDKTIFVHTIQKTTPYISLTPVGFIDIGYIPNTFSWRLRESYHCLTGTFTGEIVETVLPLIPRDPLTPTFRREDTHIKMVKFTSVKSEIRRDIKRQEIAKRKAIKRAKKMEELDRLKMANPGIQIDEESALADSEEDEPEEPLYIPKIPNPIIWLKHLESDRIWISMSGFDAGYIYEMIFNRTMPVRSTMIEGGDDIEIHTYLQIDDYLLFGMQNGFIRVNIIKSNFTDLTDYWLLAMHDNLDGVVSKIFTSADNKFLFSIGYDGNVFSYKWNGQPGPKMKVMEPFIEPTDSEDIEELDYPSLEQMKIKKEQDRQNKIASDHKARIMTILAHHREDYKALMKRNRDLPASQKITQKEFEIDPRITENLESLLETEMALVRRKLAFDVEKSRFGKEKVVDFFIKPLDLIPFQLNAIRKNIAVKSFRFQKLDDDFEGIKADLEERIRIAEGLERRFDSFDSEASIVISMPSPQDESFFAGIDQKDIIPRFSKCMLRLLQRYRRRKVKEVERYIDWEKIKSKKPDPNKNHIDDIRAIAMAEKSIGDYKLKMHPDYEPSASENVLYKLKKILHVRESIYNMKNEFNKKLLKLRKKKNELYQKIEEQRDVLDRVHNEIPEGNQKHLPEVPKIDVNLEEPELNLIELVEPSCNMEIKDIIMGDKTVASLTAKPPKKETVDKASFVVDPLNTHCVEKVQLPDLQEVYDIFDTVPSISSKSQLEMYNASKEPPPWEIKFRYFRILNRMIQQDEIIKEVEALITDFDESLEALKNDQLEITIDSKLLEMHLISMNQELSILKDCEQLEQGLLDKAHNAMTDRNALQVTINALTKQIEETKKSTDKMMELIKGIQNSFMSQVKGNKFFDFLRRIFKKKYKPPKPPLADDESEESSESDSSSSDEEGGGDSDDSQDMAPIRLDENFCPAGCDRKIYDLAFAMRNERHGMEQTILNNHKLVDDKKKEMDEVRQKMKKLDEIYTREKNNLLAFRREKQQVLNKVNAVVVLRMDQMQYLSEGDDINNLKEALLFDLENISKLNIRVGQLALETIETKRLHRVNIVHLQRMTRDCKFMNNQILVLEDEIKQAMYRKFGMVINLDEIEETTLRKYIFHLKLSLTDEKRDIEKQMLQKKKILANLQKELIIETQKGSEKLNILTILQEEKNYLMNVLHMQKKNYQKFNSTKNFELSYDLDRLRELANHQAKQIEFLEREVRTLRFKSRPLQLMAPTASDMEKPGLLEMLPEDRDPTTFSGAFSLFAPFPERIGPDPDKTAKITKIVTKFFTRHFPKDIPELIVRKYTKETTKYLSYVAVNIQGEQTPKVLDCIVDNLQNLIPKKYTMNITASDFKCLFQNISSVFDYEKSVVKIEEVIKCIVLNALEVGQESEKFNKSQVIICEIFKEMIEALTLEDFRSKKTEELLIEALKVHSEVVGKCISIDSLVLEVTDHARQFLCDDITQIPIRNLATAIQNGLLNHIQARMSSSAK